MNLIQLIRRVFFSTPEWRVQRYLAIVEHFRIHDHPVIADLFACRLQRRYGVHLSSEAVIGTGLKLPHPTGIVIGSGVTIGNHVTIYQNVTLGRKDKDADDYPTIGDGSIIYANAVVLGAVTIGRDCRVGANSVVIHDVPDGSTVVGAPARVVR